MRNENSAAFSASTFDARAATSVMPERETPGRIATACATPIRSAFGSVTMPEPFGRKRVAVSTTPVKTSAAPTIPGDANAASSRSSNRTPTTPAGTADRMILAA